MAMMNDSQQQGSRLMTQTDVENDPTAGMIEDSAARASLMLFSSWYSALGYLIGLFVTFVTITNVIHRTFEYPLLPPFENSIIGFYQWMHWVLDFFIVAPLLNFVELYVETVTPGLHKTFDFIPEITDLELVVPDWYRDLAIISMVFSRSGMLAHTIAKPQIRKNTPEESMENRRKLGWLLFYLFRTVVYPMSLLAYVSGVVSSAIGSLFAYPVYLATRSKTLPQMMWRVVFIALRGVTLGGIAWYIALLLNAPLASREDDEGLVRLVGWQTASIAIALAASISLFVWNGYALGPSMG